MFGACMDLRAAFDNIVWDKMFEQILDKGVPAVVVLVFVHAYQEQKGWVRLAGHNSDTFGLSNGSRQGSIMSPFFFSCYVDKLVKILRKKKLGCYILGVWVGASLYADDIFLLAPNRFVLQQMITVAEQFATEHNLEFSTDPVAAKSKTKLIQFRGTQRVQQPAPVILNGKQVPFCETVTHLGHELHENGRMDSDADRARASFNRRASDLRDQLFYCWPSTRVRAADLNICDAYGLMLHELSSESINKVFHSWNTNIRECWSVPYNCKTSLVEKYFASEFLSLRRQVFSRYPGFIKKLLNAPSYEIRFLSSIAMKDQRSVVCRNVNYLNHVSKLDVMNEPKCRLKEAMPYQSEEKLEPWRISLLTKFLEIKLNRSYNEYNISYSQVNSMINSLCI